MTNRENFGSRAAVIMAMAGSAIGLGNIWRFPFIVGEYGGAAFILVYIVCSFLLSLPILLSYVFCRCAIARFQLRKATITAVTTIAMMICDTEHLLIQFSLYSIPCALKLHKKLQGTAGLF